MVVLHDLILCHVCVIKGCHAAFFWFLLHYKLLQLCFNELKFIFFITEQTQTLRASFSSSGWYFAVEVKSRLILPDPALQILLLLSTCPSLDSSPLYHILSLKKWLIAYKMNLIYWFIFHHNKCMWWSHESTQGCSVLNPLTFWSIEEIHTSTRAENTFTELQPTDM